MQNKVLKLFITKNDSNKTRMSLNSINLDALGIKEDKFYNQNLQRSVLLTSIESYKIAKNEGIDLEYGSLGENILLEYNPYHLQEGARLLVGNCLLEITQNCTLCKGLSSVNSKLPKLLKHDRGIFAKVIEENSQINVGDTTEVL